MNFEKVKKVKHSKPFTVLDAIVASVLVIVTALTAYLVFRREPELVTVTAPGFYRELPLSADEDIALEHLTVHVRGGKVWVSDADCRDKTCEHTGEISLAGQTIVCLPSGVVVSVKGSGELAWEIGK